MLQTTGGYGTTSNGIPADYEQIQVPRRTAPFWMENQYLWDMPDILRHGVLLHLTRSKPIQYLVPGSIANGKEIKPNDVKSMKYHAEDLHEGFSAKETCENAGKRLCYRSEICPNGRKTTPVGGERADYKMWIPVADAPYLWVCVGEYCKVPRGRNDMCSLNTETNIGPVFNGGDRDIANKELMCCNIKEPDEVVRFRILANTVIYLAVNPDDESDFIARKHHMWKQTNLTTNSTDPGRCHKNAAINQQDSTIVCDRAPMDQYAPHLYRWNTILTPKASEEFIEMFIPRPGPVAMFAACPDDVTGGGCVRGSAISIHNNVEIVMTDVVVENSVGEIGGAVVVEDSRVFLEHSILRNNHALSFGGGAFVSSSHESVTSILSLSQGSELVYNSANKDGGGVALAGGTMTNKISIYGADSLSDMISHNSAKQSGGNLATTGSTIAIVEQLSLTNGKAENKDGGSAYFGFQSNIHFKTILVENSYAKRRGGGIAINSDVGKSMLVTATTGSKFVMDETSVVQNYAQDGGGLSVTGLELTIQKKQICGDGSCDRSRDAAAASTSIIQFNRALRGAGIFVHQSDSKKTLLKNLLVDTNCASNDTNVLDGSVPCGPDMAIKDGYKGQGGGLYCLGGSCELTSSQFQKNRAERRGGGVVAAARAKIQLEVTQIVENIATYGGGIATDDFFGPCDVFDSSTSDDFTSIVSSNTAIECGGNIEIQGSLQPVYVKGYGADAASCMSANLKRMIISHGRAKHGGGICVPDCGARFEFLKIRNNHADYNGGGVYHTGHVVKMLSVELKNNVADSRGGGVYMEGKNSHVLGNPRFVGNRARVAGGGAAIMSARGIDRWFPTKNGGLSHKDYCKKICMSEQMGVLEKDYKEITKASQLKPLGCFFFPADGGRAASCTWNDKVYVHRFINQVTNPPSGSIRVSEVWEFEGAQLHEPSNLLFEMNQALRGGAVYVAGGEPSVSYASIVYNSAGRRVESGGTVLIENGRGGAVYADKINDQQNIICQTKIEDYKKTPYSFRIAYNNPNAVAERDYAEVDASLGAAAIRKKLLELSTIDDLEVTLEPAGRKTACSKAGDTRIVVVFNHTNQGGDLPLLNIIDSPSSTRTPETPVIVTKIQAGYGAPELSLIEANMVGNVALGEFGRGGGMYANDGVVKHKNSKVTENKAASGGGLYMGKSGLFQLIEVENCGTEEDQEPCSQELLIRSNEACRVRKCLTYFFAEYYFLLI